MLKFLERRYQVGDGAAPAIQTPHQDDIDFAPTGGREQSFAQFALRRAGADLFDLDGDGPAAFGGYSRMIRICSGSVCWSCVETRA